MTVHNLPQLNVRVDPEVLHAFRVAAATASLPLHVAAGEALREWTLRQAEKSVAKG